MKKIPDNAKKVFDGIIFDVYHWEQEMFDGSLATFEALKKRDVAFSLGVYENKVIINQEEQPNREPFLSLPGGMCEKDIPDTMLNAQREFLEETGFDSKDWSFWFSSDQFGHIKIDSTIYFYIAKNCVKVGEQKLDSGEKIEIKLLTFEEFLELRHAPKLRTRELVPILEKAASSEEEKQKLKDLLGVTNK